MVIDPVIEWSTYLGGSSWDEGNGIAVDSSGVYVTGEIISGNFPTQNAYDDTLNGGDAFVTKFNTDGTLAWSTYLGGNDWDEGKDIAVDGSGVYVTGWTWSDDFPTENAYDDSRNGYNDAFVTKFNHDGTLAWSTYLGGSVSDSGRGIAVDSNGVYVTGYTKSNDFPTENAYDYSYNGDDAFVTKFNHDGALVWSTYLGGSGGDAGYGIAVDSSGVYVTGYTGSDDFPTENAYDDSFNGSTDAFVTKFNHDGALIWSTYLGGGYVDVGFSIAVDSSGVYVTGVTISGNFPTENAYDDSYNGWGDVFVTKLFEPDASIKAMQNGNEISVSNPGVLGVDIDCVGAIDYNDANDFHCFLVPDTIDPNSIDWANIVQNSLSPPAGVIQMDTTTATDCASVGLTADKCFAITFDSSNFNPATWHFVGVFTENSNVIDIANDNFRVASFMIPEADASIKAMQNGNVISVSNPGVLNSAIDCVGAINYTSANDFECTLFDGDGNLIDGPYATTSTIPCPTVFPSTYTCFRVTFPASDFNQGIYTFGATFTENNNTIDIQGPDFRVASFLVLPETAIGAIAVFASIFGAFIAYSMRRR